MNGYAPEFVNGYAPEFSELSILCSQPKSEKVIKSGKKQYPGNLSESTEKPDLAAVTLWKIELPTENRAILLLAAADCDLAVLFFIEGFVGHTGV